MSQGLCLIISECVARRPTTLAAIIPVMIARAALALFNLNNDGNTLMIYVILSSPPASADTQGSPIRPAGVAASPIGFRILQRPGSVHQITAPQPGQARSPLREATQPPPA